MIVDGILFIGILLALHFYRNKHPNFLFFPQRAMFFLPPDTDNPGLSVLKVNYDDVKDHPLSTEFNRILMTIACIVLYVPWKFLLNMLLQDSSMLLFYISIIIGCYMCKIGVNIISISVYNKKVCVLVSVGLNALFYLLMITMEGIEGLYDQSLGIVVLDYQKHLSIVFGREIHFITRNTVAGFVFVLNIFVVLLIIPSTIKFGNWYTKTLKEANQKIDAKSGEGANEQEQRQAKKRSQTQAKKLVFKLTVYLFVVLFFILLCHNSVRTVIPEYAVDILRTLMVVTCSYLILTTMSQVIEFNASFSYRHVLQFFSAKKDPTRQQQLRRTIYLHLYQIWYNYFQHAARIIIMILLFVMVINCKYLNPHVCVQNQQHNTIDHLHYDLDISCVIHTDQLTILENVYKCNYIPSSGNLQEKVFMNGAIETRVEEPGVGVEERIKKYGFLNNAIIVEILELLLWYSMVTLHALTVVYILFLRKTVYEI